MTHALHRSLQQSPDKVATIFRERRRSFREFTDRVARLAGALQSLGMQPGDRVAMLSFNSDYYLEYLMGVWWGGGVANPVNIRWSAAEIAYSLNDCDTNILILADRFAPMAEAIQSATQRPLTLIYAGEKPVPDGMKSFEQLIEETQPVPDAGRGYDDLAIIMYTGGTTGFPKGVTQTHAALWCASIQRNADVAPLREGRVLHAAPLFHIGALGRAIGQFIAGESHVIIPLFEPAELLRTVERERVTEVTLVPTMLQMLIDHPDFGQTDLSCVRRISYGASPITASTLETSLQLLPHVEFTQAYGLTETMIVASNPHENHTGPARTKGLHMSAGRAIFGIAVKIVDAEGVEVPRGTVGEIAVKGPNVTHGYWNRPQETASALRGGWLHTGDGAYMDDAGYIFIVDRIKDMIVSGSENVYSAEVENVICRHPAVASCAVIGLPDEKWGETVHAVVVLRPDMTATEAQIREHCRQAIAGYKCPKSVEFRAELPLSGIGKVLKRELRAAMEKQPAHAGH
ncbi:long-chain fatty acid--CoA ligase [Paraburkholderia caffeinitolerans]